VDGETPVTDHVNKRFKFSRVGGERGDTISSKGKSITARRVRGRETTGADGRLFRASRPKRMEEIKKGGGKP